MSIDATQLLLSKELLAPTDVARIVHRPRRRGAPWKRYVGCILRGRVASVVGVVGVVSVVGVVVVSVVVVSVVGVSVVGVVVVVHHAQCGIVGQRVVVCIVIILFVTLVALIVVVDLSIFVFVTTVAFNTSHRGRHNILRQICIDINVLKAAWMSQLIGCNNTL